MSDEGLTLARRHGRAIICGQCGRIAIAEAQPDGVLTFPLDAHLAWKGWRRIEPQHVDAPGGTWRVAPSDGQKSSPLHGLLAVLPAIIECPGCGADNLLDPGKLEVRALQIADIRPEEAAAAG